MCNLKNAKMKEFLIILLSSVISSCAFEPSSSINVHIDKSIISNVDSIFMVDSSTRYYDEKSRKIEPGVFDYSLLRTYSQFQIKLKLKKSQVIISDTIKILNTADIISITKVDNKINFKLISESKISKYVFIFFISLVVLLTIKILTTILILSPNSVMTYIKQISTLNLIYLVIFYPLIIVFESGYGFILFCAFLITLISDLVFLQSYYNDKGQVRTIIAGIISNILFWTIGLFILSFLIFINY